MAYSPAFGNNFFSGGQSDTPQDVIPGTVGGPSAMWKLLVGMGLAGYLVSVVRPVKPGTVDFDRILEEVQEGIERRKRRNQSEEPKPFGIPFRPSNRPSPKEVERVIRDLKPSPPVALEPEDHEWEEPYESGQFHERRRYRRRRYYYPYLRRY